MTQVLWELLWLLRGLHAKWSCWLWVKAISVCFLLILSTFSNVAAVQLPVDLLLILIFTWSLFPAAVTPFEVFVFSDASPVTADKSSASGFIFLCLGFFIASLCSIFVCEKLAIASLHVFKTLNFCPQDSTLRTSRNPAMESKNLVHSTKSPKNSFQTENLFLDFWQRESRKPTPLEEEWRCIWQEQDFTSKHMHLNLRSNNWISSVKRIYCKYVNMNISRNICAWT